MSYRKKLAVAAFLFILLCLQHAPAQETSPEIYFFYSTTCPHCLAEKAFLEEEIEPKYPGLKIDYIIAKDHWGELEEMAAEYNTSTVGVPRTFIGSKAFIGFTEDLHGVTWHEAYRAYMGSPYSLEVAIRQLLNLTGIISEVDAIDIARKDCRVCNLTDNCAEVVIDAVLVDGRYIVSWWTYDRIRSDLAYPDLITEVDSGTGHILDSWQPDSAVYGLKKPAIPQQDLPLLLAQIMVILVPMAYMVFGTRLQRRYWISAFALSIVIFLFIYFSSMSSANVLEDARKYSFPIFTSIIALIDGFNPCAFAVLAFLLSILTHTKSRKMMMFIGSVFIMTSGLMYFLFIMALLLFTSWVSGEYMDLIRYFVAAVALIAGAINIKDYFFFKQGISLTMSPEKQGGIFRRAGSLVRQVQQASTGKELFIAAIATMALAALVNLVELGCTFILPAGYIQALILNYSGDLPVQVLYTLLYAIVYVVPLFAILGIFTYSFKSERLTEGQGRILKLIGGLVMAGLGLILLFAPELLTFGG